MASLYPLHDPSAWAGHLDLPTWKVPLTTMHFDKCIALVRVTDKCVDYLNHILNHLASLLIHLSPPYQYLFTKCTTVQITTPYTIAPNIAAITHVISIHLKWLTTPSSTLS